MNGSKRDALAGRHRVGRGAGPLGGTGDVQIGRVRLVLTASIVLAQLAVLLLGGCVCAMGGGSSESEPQPASAVDNGPASNEFALETVWTVAGEWPPADSVDVDPRTGDVYGLRNLRWHEEKQRWTAEVCRISSGGRLEKVVEVGGDTELPTKIAAARLTQRGEMGFVVANVAGAGQIVRAFASDGTLRWSRTLPSSVNTMRAVDLDGDNVDEAVVGTSGDGVFALDAAGQQRWHSLVHKYVDDVAIVPAETGGQPGIAVAGVHRGKGITMLDAAGQNVREIQTEFVVYIGPRAARLQRARTRSSLRVVARYDFSPSRSGVPPSGTRVMTIAGSGERACPGSPCRTMDAGSL